MNLQAFEEINFEQNSESDGEDVMLKEIDLCDDIDSFCESQFYLYDIQQQITKMPSNHQQSIQRNIEKLKKKNKQYIQLIKKLLNQNKHLEDQSEDVKNSKEKLQSQIYSEKDDAMRKIVHLQKENKTQLKLLEEYRSRQELNNIATQKLQFETIIFQTGENGKQALKSLTVSELDAFSERLKTLQLQIDLEKTEIINHLSSQNQGLQKDAKQKQDDIDKCVICQTYPITIVIKPCNHVILCSNCITKIDKCPYDRIRIQFTEKIYLK